MTLGRLARAIGAGVALAAVPRCAATADAPPQATRILWVEGVKNAYPRWSRDGTRILYESNRAGKWQLHVMDADGSHDRALTSGAADNQLPDWSPDNAWIAFVSNRDGNDEIHVMREDGTGLRNLSKSPARDIHPYWSPDGAWILFNSDRDGKTLQLYEVRPDGTGLRRLAVSEDEETCARVSPRGDSIVLLANLKEGRDDVLLRRRDGSHPVNLTRDAAPDGWPTWTPDGGRIVYASQRGGPFALYSMKPDGSDVRQLTFPEKAFFDARPSVSPDGRRIVFNRQKGETIGIFVTDVASDVAR
jgi:Tol biopolymer transport system component